jgi:predicted nucleic acid-binding protein
MERFFLDTVFVQAMLNKRDQYHPQAMVFAPRLRAASEVWITEAVLIEICNALSASDRIGAARFVRTCYQTKNIRVVPVTTDLLQRCVEFYAARGDKQWGLTDCISFIVMQEHGLVDAVTADTHFRQAGFRALLLEP